MAVNCMLCDRNMSGTGEVPAFMIDRLSASQGSGQQPIAVCTSCDYYFWGEDTGMTTTMRMSCVMPRGSFMEQPKDMMYKYLGSACSGFSSDAAAGTTYLGLSGWFGQVRMALSGGAITPV